MTGILEKITDAWARAWGDGDTEAFRALVHDGYTRNSRTSTEDIDDVIRQIVESHAAFSSFTMEIERAIEDDNLVAILWRSRGIHTGEFMGVPPTDRPVTVNGASFISHGDGKITEETVVWDPRDMLTSISIVHLGDQRMSKIRKKMAREEVAQ